jgi:transcriptional regulator with XRE-family HTH domain
VKIKGLQKKASLVERYPELAAIAEDSQGLAEIASALIQLRSRTGQKQVELAKAAGVAVSLLSELENARNEGVAWRTLVRLAKGAGAHIEIRFDIDANRAGTVDVHVDGDYAIEDEFHEVAALIDERNEAMRQLGYLAA